MGERNNKCRRVSRKMEWTEEIVKRSNGTKKKVGKSQKDEEMI
jgi:hypothetical protein